jgi:nitroreductase/dihydropteridine reductase
MNLIDAVQTRHTVKAFESGRLLSQASVDALLAVLHNSPSSVNSQPWHYVFELGLRERGLMSVVLAAFGHRSEQDFNASLPKLRLPREQVFTFM